MAHVYCNWLGNPVINTGPVNVPLWFIRDLMVVMLFSPFIYLVVHKLKLIPIILLAVAYLSDIWLNIPGFSACAFLFFSIGAYYRIIHHTELITKKGYMLVVILSIVLMLTSVYYDGRRSEFGSIVYPIFIIFGVSALILSVLLYTKRKTKNLSDKIIWLSSTSFFMFASHNLLLPYIRRIVYSLISTENYAILTARYFVIPILATLSVLVIYKFLSLYLNKVLSVLTGNR